MHVSTKRRNGHTQKEVADLVISSNIYMYIVIAADSLKVGRGPHGPLRPHDLYRITNQPEPVYEQGVQGCARLCKVCKVCKVCMALREVLDVLTCFSDSLRRRLDDFGYGGG